MNSKLFDIDNPLLRFLSYVGDLLILSIIWWMCTICILPAVPASIALYDSVSRGVFGTNSDTYCRFWRTLKNEFGIGILIMLFWGGVVLLPQILCLRYDLISQLEYPSMILLYGSTLISASVFVWLIPLVSRFNIGFGSVLVAAARIAAANLFRTIAIILLIAGVCVACIQYPPLAIIAPGIVCTVHQFVAESVLKKYM